uniref:Uncharacterized protein n=1 Tax=Candidatus Nitrotoga fabula TaxID=2182327 RepID=A0A2X0QS10_9PROT|nr:protein of unknown function [Candidatus Nitrotoga fabula]
MECSRLIQHAACATGEHWAHNAAHITGGIDEEVFFINRLWTGFDSHHPLHEFLETSSVGSTPLTGDEHSSDPVNHTVPSALSQNSHAVIFKISEPICSAREHLHLRVESFGDAIRFGETPHAHNRFEPR